MLYNTSLNNKSSHLFANILWTCQLKNTFVARKLILSTKSNLKILKVLFKV